MIHIKNATKTFVTSSGTVRALENCSLNINKGEICGVIGHSGAGKSTLVRLINRLEKPDSGSVTVLGNDLATLDTRALLLLRRKIGMIFQHFNLLHAVSVFENVAAPLRNLSLGRRQVQEKVQYLLERVGLSDKALAYPRQLSGGQKQRVAIARALSYDPEILLCDEATSALDPHTTKAILELIGRISAEIGLTVVIITHQMDVVKMLCSRVAVMDCAHIVEQGDLLSIFAHPQSKITREFIAQSEPSTVFTPLQGSQHPLYRLSFAGSLAETPFIAHVIRKYAVTPNILGGSIQRLSSATFGNLVLEMDGSEEDINRALEFLRNSGVIVEVM